MYSSAHSFYKKSILKILFHHNIFGQVALLPFSLFLGLANEIVYCLNRSKGYTIKNISISHAVKNAFAASFHQEIHFTSFRLKHHIDLPRQRYWFDLFRNHQLSIPFLNLTIKHPSGFLQQLNVFSKLRTTDFTTHNLR